MEYTITPEDPHSDCLEVRIVVGQPLATLKDVLERALDAYPAAGTKLDLLLERPTERLYLAQAEKAGLSARVAFTEELGVRTRIVIENRLAFQGECRRQWKSMVAWLTTILCEQLSNLGYVSEAQATGLVFDLRLVDDVQPLKFKRDRDPVHKARGD